MQCSNPTSPRTAIRQCRVFNVNIDHFISSVSSSFCSKATSFLLDLAFIVIIISPLLTLASCLLLRFSTPRIEGGMARETPIINYKRFHVPQLISPPRAFQHALSEHQCCHETRWKIYLALSCKAKMMNCKFDDRNVYTAQPEAHIFTRRRYRRRICAMS